MKQTILRGLQLAAGLTATAATLAATPVGMECHPKADSYTFLVDYSGSMMESPEQDELTQEEKQEKKAAAEAAGHPLPEMTEKEKEREKTKRIATAKTLIKQLTGPLSAYSLQNGLYTVAPYTEIAPYKNRPEQNLNEEAQTLKENMEVLGRRSPIGLGIEQHAARMEKSGLNGPVYLITDGRQAYGRPVKDAIQTFYRIRPESCLHIISLADTREGEELVAALAASQTCSRILHVRDIQENPETADRFISETVPLECREQERILSVTGINFAFDRYDIDGKSEAILHKALEYIRAQDERAKIEIVGWTDWVGSDTYNLRLSQKRAEAVKAWLVKKGIPAERMRAIGKGKSYRYDNRTEKGRYLNRRMDFRFYTE